jgi:hypothetical protein
MMTQLDLPIRGTPVAVDIADIARQQSWASALTYCASKSGKQDKFIAADIGMQDAVWSRCKTGQNSPSGEQLVRLMQACGNSAPLYWLLLQMGYDPASLRPLESETERALREANEALEAERAKNRMLVEIVSGRVAA